MRSFEYVRTTDVAAAIHAAASDERIPPTNAPAQFLAGGTTLLDLMKLGTMRPERVVDINDLRARFGAIEGDRNSLHLGAFVRMAEAADHPLVRREFPVIAQSLQLAASAQIRNMATLGGNVLQRTRCNYFRDPSWPQCNKRAPGTGCGALNGVNRKHAILGTSNACIAAYPGDFAQALVALDAKMEIAGPGGARAVPFETLHVEPGSTPDIETVLAPGDVITGFQIDGNARRSLYQKIRDRQSYEFALASAAVVLDMHGNTVIEARIALGGVATRPWRAREAEVALKGHIINPQTASHAAKLAFAGAVTHGENDFKPELGRRTLVRALMRAATMEA